MKNTKITTDLFIQTTDLAFIFSHFSFSKLKKIISEFCRQKLSKKESSNQNPLKTQHNRSDVNGGGNKGGGMEMITEQRRNEDKIVYINCCNNCDLSILLGKIILIAFACFIVYLICSKINVTIEKVGNELEKAIEAVNWTSVAVAFIISLNNGTWHNRESH